MGLFNWLFGSRDRTQVIKHDLPQRDYHRVAVRRPVVTGKFGQARHKPKGEWVQTTTVIKVAGIHHRRDDVMKFCAAVQTAERAGRIYGVDVLPEPENPHDRNAIAVYGHAGRQSWKIGYLDRDTAEEIATDVLDKDLMISAELYSIWLGDDGYCDVNIIVLAPPGHSMSSRHRRG